MLLHINKFLDRVRASEGRADRQIVMSLAEARDLHADITKLLLALHASHEQITVADPVTTDVQIDGGTF